MAKKVNDTEITQELIDETAAMSEAAEDMAAMIIASDIQKENEIKTRTQEERERLIAEAYRMMGRVEGLDFISKVATVSTFVALKNIKDNKIYKDMPAIVTWENFCNSVGYSRRHVDEQIDNISNLGAAFLETVSTFGIGYRELRQLKKATTNGILAIQTDTITVDGETIPLADKDELKDALERVIAAKDQALKAKDELNKTQLKVIEADTERKRRLNEEKEAAWAETDKYKKELAAMNNGELTPVPIEDLSHFNKIREIENQFDLLFFNLQQLAMGDLSPFNERMLGGVVGKMLLMTDDTRMAMQGKSDFYFEGSSLTDAEMESLKNLTTPTEYILSDKNK